MNRKFLAAATVAIAVASGVAAACPAALADDSRPQPSHTSIRPPREPVPVTITAKIEMDGLFDMDDYVLEGWELTYSISVDATGRWQSVASGPGFDADASDSDDEVTNKKSRQLGQLSPETLNAWQRMATSDELAEEQHATSPAPDCDDGSPGTITLKAGEVTLSSPFCLNIDEGEEGGEDSIQGLPPMFGRMFGYVSKFADRGEQPGKGAWVSLRHGTRTIMVRPEGRWTAHRDAYISFLPSTEVASGWLTGDQIERLQKLITSQEFGSEEWLLAREGVPCPAPNGARLSVEGREIVLPCNLVDPLMLPITNQIDKLLTEATGVGRPGQPAICPDLPSDDDFLEGVRTARH